MNMDIVFSSALGEVVSCIGDLRLWDAMVDVRTRTADVERVVVTSGGVRYNESMETALTSLQPAS